MIFKQINAGWDRNFSYLIADEDSKEAAIIDPGSSPEEVVNLLQGNDLTLKYIINTHDHPDHTGGNAVLTDSTKARVAMHETARSPRDVDLKDGDIVNHGKLEMHIIHTPGHTKDSICILVENELVTGDTLFVGKVGGTGSEQDAREEYDSIHNKLMKLDPKTRVCPGHDYGPRPSSTIEDELRENPFILRDSFESFLDLKLNWLEYKIKHGIE